MNFGLAIIVAFAFLMALCVFIPIIPTVFGWFVAGLDGIFFTLSYVGASCDLVNKASTYLLFGVLFWLIVRLVKQFLV